MKKKIFQGCLIGVALLTATAIGQAATIKLACSAKQTIGSALKKLKPGDTLLVTGTCKEHVVIGPGVHSITLDGQGKATINGPDATETTISVRGRNITIKGFTITGGQDGIAVRQGGEAVINGNTIKGAGRQGIIVQRSSFGVIADNTVENNTGNGVVITASSFALIGFLTTDDKVASPNTIQNNGTNGIVVSRSSAAVIAGNTIRNNKLNGVAVIRASQADVSSSTIDGNGANGILVNQNSAVQLGNDKGTGIFDSPNITSASNGSAGIRCTILSSADGRLGTLNGNSGAKEFDTSCVDSLIP